MAYCLRAFYGLLRDLIQGAWVRFVQKLNANRLGNITDLGTFLFGQERASLDAYRPILMDVQHGTCLYCRKPLPRQIEVDHFVPWSRYPDRSGPQLRAGPRQLQQRQVRLPGRRRPSGGMERAERVTPGGTADPAPRGGAALRSLGFDPGRQWAYEQTENANGQVWVMEKVLRHLGPTWRQCLSA